MEPPSPPEELRNLLLWLTLACLSKNLDQKTDGLTSKTRSFSTKRSLMGVVLIEIGRGLENFERAPLYQQNPPSRNPASATVQLLIVPCRLFCTLEHVDDPLTFNYIPFAPPMKLLFLHLWQCFSGGPLSFQSFPPPNPLQLSLSLSLSLSLNLTGMSQIICQKPKLVTLRQQKIRCSVEFSCIDL